MSRYIFPMSPIHCITMSHQIGKTLQKTYQVRGKYSIIFLIASINLKLYIASPIKISQIILNHKYSQPGEELKADRCSQSCFRNPYWVLKLYEKVNQHNEKTITKSCSCRWTVRSRPNTTIYDCTPLNIKRKKLTITPAHFIKLDLFQKIYPSSFPCWT